VLRTALAIEKDLGRERTGLNGKSSESRIYHSRPIDIDLIFYDDLVVDTHELTLPHPRMHLRRFVLEPLTEIIPTYRHPVTGKTVKQLLYEI
jgi:2-amino-4-hydroxy-6-hydroxymethyldihydropteridine diphosphokinase